MFDLPHVHHSSPRDGESNAMNFADIRSHVNLQRSKITVSVLQVAQ